MASAKSAPVGEGKSSPLTGFVRPVKSLIDRTFYPSAVLYIVSFDLEPEYLQWIAHRTPHLTVDHAREEDEKRIFRCRRAVEPVHNVRESTVNHVIRLPGVSRLTVFCREAWRVLSGFVMTVNA